MRFRQEAQSAARMAHPTIVRVFDAGEETVVDSAGHEVQLPFIVMEYVEGRLLKDIIHDGPLEPVAAVRVIDGVLTALEYSHRAGVVHRDIKPGNIMITTTGQVKVMDFGIARAVSDSSTTVAQTTAILGTASYFSPEQAKGETVDARTDLYSTGVVLFEMLTGRPPFRGDTPGGRGLPARERTSGQAERHQPQGLAGARRRRAARAHQEPRAAVPDGGGVPCRRRHRGIRSACRCIASPTRRPMLFGAPTSSLSSSELALRQLTEDETMTRTAAASTGDLDLVGHHRRRRHRDRRHVLGVQPAAHRRPALERPRDPHARRRQLRGGRAATAGARAPRDADRRDERHGAGRPGHPHRPGRR
jgi:serine/threonine-protein kinase